MTKVSNLLGKMNGPRALVIGAMTAGVMSIVVVPAVHAAPTTAVPKAVTNQTAKADAKLSSSLGLNIMGSSMYQGDKTGYSNMTAGTLGANLNTMGGLNLSSMNSDKSGATTATNVGANAEVGVGVMANTTAANKTISDETSSVSSTAVGVGAGLNVGTGVSTNTSNAVGGAANGDGLTNGNLLGGDLLNGSNGLLDL
jgi:hypothetical protein